MAIIALVLSLGMAAFSIFQWWHSRTQDAIAGAIEISKKYTNDTDMRKGRLYVLGRGTTGDDIPQGEERHSVANFMFFLEYASDLANKSRIDEHYLSAQLKCDVKAVTQRMDFLKKTYGIQLRLNETKTFSTRIADDCGNPAQSN